MCFVRRRWSSRYKMRQTTATHDMGRTCMLCPATVPCRAQMAAERRCVMHR